MAALSFLTELYASMERSGEELNLSMIQRWFEKLFPNAYIEDIFSPEPGESDYDSELKLHEAFLHRSGLDTVGRKPLMLFNGIIFDQAGIHKMGGFEDSVVALCMEELVRVQYAVYHGRMSVTDSISAMYQKSGVVVTRFNSRILSARISDNTLGQQFLEFGREQPVWPKVDSEPTVSQLLTHFVDHMRYFQKGDLESALRPITVWIIVGDLDAIFSNITYDGRRQQVLQDFKLAHTAITYLRSAQSSKGLRIGFVHNPSTNLTEPLQSKRGDRWLTRLLYLIAHPIQVPAEQSSTRHDRNSIKFVEQMSARNFANRLLKEAVDGLKSGHPYPPLSELVVSGVDTKLLENALRELDYEAFLHRHSVFCRRVLGLKPGERAAVVNGRIIGPLGPTEDLIVDDLRLLEKVALDMKATQLADSLSKMIGDKLSGLEAVSELTWQVASVLHPSDDVPSSSITDTDTVEGILSKSRMRLAGLSFKHSGFQIFAPPEQPALELLAIVNPTSRETQRLSHVLTVLQQSLSCNVKVSLNPVLSLSELPLKNFYRFVWEPALFDFESSTSKVAISPDLVTPRAEFVHLPGQPLLTLGMDAPHGWMVAAVEAVHDLDNLRLADAHSTVEALFELEYLLLEGHCFEEGSMKPPRGLQLTLGPASDLGRYDTIVMANLGYFQLKADPGIWHLNIRPGRSRDLYTMIDDDDMGTHVNSSELVINFNSFRSKIITVRVKKHPERENENLVDETESSSSLTSRDSWAWLYKNSDVWATLSNYAETLCPTWLTSLRKSLQAHLPWQTCTNKQETINVFSLASGHLYERLLRIMMLTVIRHTKSPVKFWFLKNYLSPTFKDFIPHMAVEYGFDYELVQYQWPRWLHAQTEKQRIIWGYKILFLDVLFPLNVTKIIFVDADQIVRADLQELADYDLQGAPYGYTPFCDSRKEMDGFRFWKQGYWASHLAGRPYHISALYVVDLVRFRQLAAGDRLRGQYHGLSQDPNSLSNLDQDLPNNMIHQVPIKSLPQEWLWCETWCSDESKTHAKTIDLCNNPQTKEPKLSAAMRIAPEWVDYDREIKRLWRRIYPPPKPKSETIHTVPEIVHESDLNVNAPPAGGHCTTDCATSSHPFDSITPAQSVATPPQKREKQMEKAEL
ncbi:UDP-glucose:glycoprotein glucosyltransferase [Paragonimus heterotremus]|uniref:UDP-glucose:glycoprotein glucosyltransferase n=1 Tax=Paragonimus heterotremus TaxID=100268 RepID=A0A8J4WJ42_9TREM|nr:UDP-glucose:glycoprotein glucosyltransferase [Paragonimus heterotremus]